MSKRVLAIEDDSSILNLIHDILNEEGFEVIPSNNSTPLNSLDEINPDVIILDHFLGNSLGQILCKELKEDPETLHIPVILISGASDLEGIALSCNADSYIKKPFAVSELIDTVKKLL